MNRSQITLSLASALALGACGGPPQASRVEAPGSSATPGDGLRVTRGTGSPVALRYVGDVRDVLAGRVPPGSDRWIDAAPFRFGFEVGSPIGVSSLGEFLTVNGIAYAKSTDERSPDYYRVVRGRRFVSTGGAFIARDERPSFLATYRGARGAASTVGALYEALYEQVGQPFCMAGPASFQTFEAIAISRAPVLGEALMDNRARYYARGAVKEPDVEAFLVGCVARFDGVRDPSLRDGLQRILYRNPFDTSSGSTSHAHVVILSRRVTASSEVVPEVVRDVQHLLSQSTLSRFDAEVFTIDRVLPVEVVE